MKKLFCSISIFIFSFLPCFAEYNPIPIDKQKEYKIEMENIINKHVPIIKKKI